MFLLCSSSLSDIMQLKNCRIINLPKIADPRGNLTFIEAGRHVQFGVRRVYYLYDVPSGAERGGYAHKGLRRSQIKPVIDL